MKQKIKEIIVVEGKNDTNRLQSYFDCDTIETGGDQLQRETVERIKEAQKRRGVIVFTDPDHPGEHIRRMIQAHVPDCKHAFIDKNKARTTKKVGVEHASQKDLWESLCRVVTFEQGAITLSWEEFVDLGLIGLADSAQRRKKICQKFLIGPCNAKTCFKRLNQMRVTRKEIEEE